MKREIISQGVGNINPDYIMEAADRIPEGKRTGSFRRSFVKNVIAAVLVLCVLAGGAAVLFSLPGFSRAGAITVYACGADEEITAAGTVIHTGTISNTGAMKGHPLMFYLTGTDIATVRFSCKNQQLYFMDWTEKREEYGNAQNFTVTYGEDENEYYYLTIDWVPNAIIRELTDNAETTIATLPAELREDIIVMEITFANGKTATKAITVSLLEDGTFFAAFDSYKINENDDFIKRTDSAAIPRDVLYAQGGSPGHEETPGSGEPVGGGAADDMPGLPDDLETAQPVICDTDDPNTNDQADLEEARKVAQDYYAGTVFQVISMEVKSRTEDEIVFTVHASRGGKIQDPDRSVTLKLDNGEWKVINEGY